MPFFDKAGILLIHIPKTGGTSVEVYFSQKYNIPLNVHSIYYKYYENRIDRDIEQREHRLAKAWDQAMMQENHIIKMLRGPVVHPMQHTMPSLSLPNNVKEPPKYSKHIPAYAIAKQMSTTPPAQRPQPQPPNRPKPPSMSTQEISVQRKEQIRQSLPEYIDVTKVQVSREVKHSLHHFTWKELKKYQDVFWKSVNIKQDLFGEQLIEYRAIRLLTVVRNPYDRILSELFFLDWIKPSFTANQVHVKLRQYLLSLSTFDNHKLPQHLFVTEEDGSLLRGLIVLRTETLTKDMRAQGFSDFNIKENAAHHKIQRPVNRGDHTLPTYVQYLNTASIQMINRYYREDFDLFGYPRLEEEVVIDILDTRAE